MTRKAVRIRIEQLVELIPRPPDEFFVDWRCRLCHLRTGALDRESAISAAADHLQETHRASGGHHVKPRRRTR